MGLVESRRPHKPPPWLVALDPAKRRCGVAVFCEGRLLIAGTLHTKRAADLPGVIFERVRSWTGRPLAVPVWVVEAPVVYARARAREKDLQGLVALIDRIEARVGYVTHITPPSIWKGNVSKRATKHRVRKRLEPSELDGMLDDSEDTFDAIGIGLWYVRRVNRGLVPYLRG